MNTPTSPLRHLAALTDEGRRALESAIQSNPERRKALAALTAREASAKGLSWTGEGWEPGHQDPDALQAALLARVPDWPQTDEEALYLFDWMTKLLPAAVEPRLWDRWLALLGALEGQRLQPDGAVDYEGMPDPDQERALCAELGLDAPANPQPWPTLEAAREALKLGGPLLAQATAAATQDPRVMRAFCERALAHMRGLGFALQGGQWVDASRGPGEDADALARAMRDPEAQEAREGWRRHAPDAGLELLLRAVYEDVGLWLGPQGVVEPAR